MVFFVILTADESCEPLAVEPLLIIEAIERLGHKKT